MAKMSTALNIEDKYTSQATKLKASILAHLWNEDTKIAKMSDASSPTDISQDINAYAVTTGIVPTAAAVTNPDSTSLPLAFRNLPGWDESQIVSPYASGFAAEAFFLSNQPEAALALIKRLWGIMADSSSENYSGAHWEAMKVDGTPFGHDTSLAHGWSTWPVFLLPMYIGGVRCLEPGWRRWCVRPVLVCLENVAAKVETVKGMAEVYVNVKKEVRRGDMKVRVPRGTICEVSPPKGWKFGSEKEAGYDLGPIAVEGRDDEVLFNLIIE